MQTLRVCVRSGLGSDDLAPTPLADVALAGRADPFGSSAASQGVPRKSGMSFWLPCSTRPGRFGVHFPLAYLTASSLSFMADGMKRK